MSRRDTVPPHEVRLAFVGSVTEVVAACAWVEANCRSAGVHPDSVYAIQVCTEELLGNILRHGDRKSPRIEVVLSVGPGRISLTVEDDGRPFDVSAAVPHRVNRTLDTIEPGGLGIQLIRAFASDVVYTRAGLGNRVVLTFDDPRGA